MEVPGPQGIALRRGERVTARLTANHIRDRRAYEGYLYLTSQRVIHYPWAAAMTRGAHAFAIDLPAVTSVDAAPRGTGWRDASWRHRLRITTLSGDCELFVVWRVGKSVELIERARKAATG